jgi:hypothetical protein
MYSIIPQKAQTTLTAHHLNLQIINWDVLHSKLHYCILFLIRADGQMYHVSYDGQCRYLYCDLILLVCGIVEYKHIHYFPTHISDYNDHGAKKHWLQRHNVLCQEISICQLTPLLLFLTKSCDSISWTLNACRISSMLLHTRWLGAWQSMGPSLDATSEVGWPTIASSNVTPVIVTFVSAY